MTGPDMFAASYATLIGETVGTISDKVEDLKKLKYQDSTISHHFIPIAIETSGVIGATACLWGGASRIRERGMHTFISF